MTKLRTLDGLVVMFEKVMTQPRERVTQSAKEACSESWTLERCIEETGLYFWTKWIKAFIKRVPSCDCYQYYFQDGSYLEVLLPF